jgi:hypothetical protein
MPGGLLALVCYGNENVMINGNPQVTWFYKTFQRYTHFSQEPIQVPLEGPNQLTMDAPILLKAKIPRQGDLLSDLVLRLQLPDIFSKAYIQKDLSGNFVLDRAYEFAWVRQVGVRMIDTVTFTIGGQTIQEFTSDWISARALLDLDNRRYKQWRVMIGDVPELFDPAQGIYADASVPSGSTYPNVVAWQGTTLLPNPVQNSAPSIPGRLLRIPLGLWFSDFIANSLPLVGLQYHDCEIQIRMRPIRDLYTVLDPSGNRLRPGTRLLSYLPSDQYTSVWNPNWYGPMTDTLNNNYGTYTDPLVTLRHFLTDISGNIPVSDAWPLNATLEATYSFVRDTEQLQFSRTTLRYNVRQAQNFIFSGVTTRSTYRLDVHNIATRLVYFARRSDSLPYRNQSTNLTNWIHTQGALRPVAIGGAPNGSSGYGITPSTVLVGGVPSSIGRSGLNLQGLQRRILRNMFLTANGQPLFDSEDSNYFTDYVSYQYLRGNTAPFDDYGLASQSEMWPLHCFSFAIDGSSVEQPMGTLNTSRIDRLEMDLDVEPIPVGARYTYELQVFVETLNFLEISSGLGGLKFAK